jgi:tetratricopeptide (TPR) repeat protein
MPIENWERIQDLKKAAEYLARAEKQNPGLLQTASRRADIATTRADAYLGSQSWEEAITAYESADRIFEDLRTRDPGNDGHLPEQTSLRIRLAGCYAAAERWGNAAQAAQKALDLLGELARHRPLRPNEEEQRKDAEQKLAVWSRK